MDFLLDFTLAYQSIRSRINVRSIELSALYLVRFREIPLYHYFCFCFCSNMRELWKLLKNRGSSDLMAQIVSVCLLLLWFFGGKDVLFALGMLL